MLSNYQRLNQQYSRLKELVLDIDQFLQNTNNYAQFEPDIRTAILNDSNEQNPDQIANLPQVVLIRSVRDSIRSIAKDFESSDYTKLLQMLYHLQSFWYVGKNYLLAEHTIALSPEFNSKILSLVNIILQSNQFFREELNNLKINPEWIFANSKEDAVDDIIKWKHYREKISTLRKILPRDNKFIPYVKNLEELLNFIINLKEKGILKSNLIVSLLDFIEDFNNASRTSIREILREYAIFSEDEFKDITRRINRFWACFLPICDEIEINSCLQQGFLTDRLKPILIFSNVLENEFNQDFELGSYPYLEARLTRISHAMQETRSLLTDQMQRQENLNNFLALCKEYIGGHKLSADQLVNLHQYVDLLDCQLYRKQFHDLINAEVEYLTKTLPSMQTALLEFTGLLNKYKSHEASFEEVRRLFDLLEDPATGLPNPQRYYEDIRGEYSAFIADLQDNLAKVENGEVYDKDVQHLLVMINLFEAQESERLAKSELVKAALDKQIKNIEKLQNLINLFEENKLPEEDFYNLLSYVNFLDCDKKTKDKYKKQIVDLDHKRKNSGYLSMIADFALGFFTEVTVPFSEIKNNIRNKLDSLQSIDISADFVTHPRPAKKQNLNQAIDNLLCPLSDFQYEWVRLSNIIKKALEENQKQIDTTQAVYSHQEKRYDALELSLKAYKPPILPFDHIENPLPPTPFSWKRFWDNVAKKIIGKITDFLSTCYSVGKKIGNFFKSLFVPKSNNLDDLVITRVEKPTRPQPLSIEPSPYKELQYKELKFLEDNLALVLGKLVNPIYHQRLNDALRKHQIIELDDTMPYFYRQAASLINVFIRFRKVVLSYSQWDMLQLSIATSNLNTENKFIFTSLLENSTIEKSSVLYDKVIKPTITRAYQIVGDLQTEENLEKSLPQVTHRIHLAVQSIANNHELDLKPLLEFLKRLGNNIARPETPVDEDIGKIYFSINKLAQFVEKGINNQDNFLVEALFSLADLLRHLRQISNCTTELLIKDQFPYLKELSIAANMLHEILVLVQNDIVALQEAGLHPDVINTLNKCVEQSNKFVSQLTPLSFQQSRILLEIGQMKSNLFKLGPDRVLQRELDNIQKLLTTESDQKFINEKLLNDIEIRLHEIKSKVEQSPSHSWFNFFTKHLSCFDQKQAEQKSYIPKPK